MCGFTSASGTVPTCAASWCNGPTAPAKRGTRSNPTALLSFGKARADPDSQLSRSLSVSRGDRSEFAYTAARLSIASRSAVQEERSMIARTRRRTVSLLCLGVLLLIALVPRDTAAQVLYGSVVGDVKDATGGALPGATLVITSTDRGFSREAVTDAAGHFTFSNLPAGVYALKAQQQGFKGFEQKEVTVTINAVIRVDVTLEVGNIGETVTVNTEPPKLQTDTADVHDTLVAAELQNAPVPLSRNYQQMYRLLPGF